MEITIERATTWREPGGTPTLPLDLETTHTTFLFLMATFFSNISESSKNNDARLLQA